jgi:DNA-binding NarL/FixJ family response regulator
MPEDRARTPIPEKSAKFASEEAPVLKIELSPRQKQVLQLLWQGETNRAIGQRLGVSESAVNVHIRNLMKMLGARNRTQVVLLTKQLLEQVEPGITPNPR